MEPSCDIGESSIDAAQTVFREAVALGGALTSYRYSVDKPVECSRIEFRRPPYRTLQDVDSLSNSSWLRHVTTASPSAASKCLPTRNRTSAGLQPSRCLYHHLSWS